MKTITLTLALVFTFFAQSLFSNNLNIELEEENYIDDIPFNTEEIVSSIPEYSVTPFVLTLEDEGYIDDIPFCTRKVYDSLMLNSSLNKFQLDNETYIDDIPFDTEEIAINSYRVNYDLAFESEEEYIDDIPFDTYEISTSSLEYYKVLLSNMSNEIQSIFNKCYDEQIENLTRNLIENLLNKIEN